MPRPPVKATEKLAYAERLGALKAELKIHEKKPLMESLREHIGKLIDKIDPLEAAAIGALSYIIQPEVKNLAALSDWIGLTQPVPFIDLSHGIEGIFWYNPPSTPQQDQTADTKREIVSWLLSIFIAFMIVRHGADIIKTLGGIGQFATFLLLK